MNFTRNSQNSLITKIFQLSESSDSIFEIFCIILAQMSVWDKWHCANSQFLRIWHSNFVCAMWVTPPFLIWLRWNNRLNMSKKLRIFNWNWYSSYISGKPAKTKWGTRLTCTVATKWFSFRLKTTSQKTRFIGWSTWCDIDQFFCSRWAIFLGIKFCPEEAGLIRAKPWKIPFLNQFIQ
jgi:hypothetical protein